MVERYHASGNFPCLWGKWSHRSGIIVHIHDIVGGRETGGKPIKSRHPKSVSRPAVALPITYPQLKKFCPALWSHQAGLISTSWGN